LFSWNSAPESTEVSPERARAVHLSPDLRVRYESRKAELLACAERIAAMGNFGDAAIEELCGLLHKLAGSAGKFEVELAVTIQDCA
jgi:hypothetical protein